MSKTTLWKPGNSLLKWMLSREKCRKVMQNSMISQPDWKRFSTFTFSTLAAARVEKVDVENDALETW